ncbi:MAG: hypothetical protein M4579_004791 [Chaenotheca gracillima]|nr:MAG: hypothetical protein M4579_004791 [Chaenotheca gracillima]
MAKDESSKPEENSSVLRKVIVWGESPLPPSILATLIAAQHLQPPQLVPLLFPPVLMFTSYLNLNSFTIDAAGLNAAWSGLYLLMARRRKQSFTSKWGPRGIIRGATLGLCIANVLGGGLTYAIGSRRSEEAKRNSGEA